MRQVKRGQRVKLARRFRRLGLRYGTVIGFEPDDPTKPTVAVSDIYGVGDGELGGPSVWAIDVVDLRPLSWLDRLLAR